MSEPYDIYPSEDDGNAPYHAIAARMGCDVSVHDDCWEGLDIPEWTTPEHYRQMREATEAYNKAARFANKLHDALWDLSSQDREGLVNAGFVTMPQIRLLAEALNRDADQLDDERVRGSRLSNKNVAAHAIATSIHRLFRKLERPITWGVTEGSPSTDYGRAVEFAIAAFGVRAHWRRPAQAAMEKHVTEQAAKTKRTNA